MRREKGTCDAGRGIGVHELEKRVLNGLRDILLGNEALVDEFATEFKRELTRLQKERHGADRRLVKDLQQVERGIRRCLDFITGGDATLVPYAISYGSWRLENVKSLPI